VTIRPDGDQRVLFREVNERIREINTTFGVGGDSYDLLCECHRADCTARVTVPIEVYDDVRAHAQQFVVVAGHEEPAAEQLVAARGEYNVVALRRAATAGRRALDTRRRSPGPSAA
jgi:hypothetical protein